MSLFRDFVGLQNISLKKVLNFFAYMKSHLSNEQLVKFEISALKGLNALYVEIMDKKDVVFTWGLGFLEAREKEHASMTKKFPYFFLECHLTLFKRYNFNLTYYCSYHPCSYSI